MTVAVGVIREITRKEPNAGGKTIGRLKEQNQNKKETDVIDVNNNNWNNS